MSEFKNENLKEKMDFEAKHNLIGFFDLLLKIDMRVNPHLYKNNNQESYDNNGNTNNTDKG